MSAANRIPENRNFLSPLSFEFSIYKTPNMNYFVQSVNIPSISIPTARVNTPFNALKYPGEKVDYNDLIVTIRVDEEMRNYYEIYNWLKSITRDTSFTGYRNISNASPGEGIFSDASLIVLSSAKTPIVRVNYINMFPVTISDLIFDTKDSSVTYLDAIITFGYERFEIEHLI